MSPYVTIFGGDVTYKNTITLEERTVKEAGNIWIGIILIVVFIIAVFIMMCFINQFQWLMGCCYSKKELVSVGREEYYRGPDE